MTCTEDDERRRARRFQLDAPVSAITRSEQVILGGYSVNVSAAGILVSFPLRRSPSPPVTAASSRCT